MAEPPLHPDVAHLAVLLGHWSGSGQGDYPTIEPFEYLETVTFTHSGKPFLIYMQRTRGARNGEPLHAEAGYFRPAGKERVEIVIAHPSGIAEVSEGPFDGTAMKLRSTHIGRTSTAKEVTEVERDITVSGDTLSYELRMAAVDQPLGYHLSATLQRSSSPAVAEACPDRLSNLGVSP